MTPIYNLGGFGLLLVLLLANRLYTKHDYEKKEAEAEAWKRAFEVERTAHIALQQDRSVQLERDAFNNKIVDDLRASAKNAEKS